MTFLLANPIFTTTKESPRDTALVIVADYSDSVEGLSGRIDRYIAELLDPERKDAHTYVRVVKFSGDAICVTESFSNNGEEVLSQFENATFEKPETNESGQVTNVPISTDSTDINTALRLARDLLDPQKTDDEILESSNKRVLLISDGRETTGDAWEAAAELQNRGVRLDTVMFDVTTYKVGDFKFEEASVMSLNILPGNAVDAGSDFSLSVKIKSTVDTKGILTIYDASDPTYPAISSVIQKQSVAVKQGESIFPLYYSFGNDKVGLRELRAEFTPENDAVVENNSMSTWLKVNGTPALLLVGSPEQTSKLDAQINSVYTTKQITPENFPRDMRELLQFDEIVLMDVHATMLHAEADDMIHRFVYNLGRGLLTTSGSTENSYISYTEEKSLIADMLPVKMTLDMTENNFAIVLVIDDSSSMIPGAFNQDGGDKFAAAIEGAVRIIENLNKVDEDYEENPESGVIIGRNNHVGVVTFHATATLQMDMVQPNDENTEALVEFVRSLDAINKGGTNYQAGLNMALEMLQDFPAPNKHIIFMSDGYPTQGNHEAIPTYLRNHGISLTTVALMTDDGAKNTLSQMATDGGGKAIHIKDEAALDGLANILEQLVEEIKEPDSFVLEESFHPMMGVNTGVLNNVNASELTLGGYIRSTAKEGALISLKSEENRPLIAEWAWGDNGGYVTSVMTDLSGEWATELFGIENNGVGLIKNMTSQSLNDEVQASGLSLSAKQDDTVAQVSVKSSYGESGQKLELKVYSQFPRFDAEMNEINGLKPLVIQDVRTVGINEFRAEFDTAAVDALQDNLPAGPNKIYYILATLTDGNTAEGEEPKILDETILAYYGGIIKEYDLFAYDGTVLMQDLAKVGGGILMPDLSGEGRPADVYSIEKPGSTESHYQPIIPCIAVFGTLIVLDFLIRNLKIGFLFRKRNKE